MEKARLERFELPTLCLEGSRKHSRGITLIELE